MQKLPIKKKGIFAFPVLHYTMESAALARRAFLGLAPQCVAVELPQIHQEAFLYAAARLPDISVVTTNEPKYFLSEPCDAFFEVLRSANETDTPAYCIDLDVKDYPFFAEEMPDPYAMHILGIEDYYRAYSQTLSLRPIHPLDLQRELFMAKRLKELSLLYDRVFFVGGFFHVERVMQLLDQDTFPDFPSHLIEHEICTLTEKSCRENLCEYAYLTKAYECWRETPTLPFPDRQKVLLHLYKESATVYEENNGLPFAHYHMQNLMKFSRNYALFSKKLTPNFFQILTAAKGCVDHNYAYEVWRLGTEYSFLKNIDNLKELPLEIEELWGKSKKIWFHLKEKQRKQFSFSKRKKDQQLTHFQPPSPFAICSYPPEDFVIENFASFLKKKGIALLSEEGTHSIPFLSSLEDGIDVRETLRKWNEKKIYVKLQKKPPKQAGSVCVVFDEDMSENEEEKFPWKTTWIGEHHQESDMAFFASPIHKNVIGPGISRCQYGGFMLSYPPCRLWDVWSDPDYALCKTKGEVLLLASIDYSINGMVVYVANKPPAPFLKNFASRFGKKIIYVPIGQLSPPILQKIRTFHVLEGKDKREIAEDYIF